MEYHVHLISVGSKAETAFNVIRSDMQMDKIYLFNNDNPDYQAVEDEIRERFSSFPLDGIETAEIKPFDYDDVFQKVIELYNKEAAEHPEGVVFHINFTMGTRITVGAMCSAAYSINADLYYVQEDRYSDTGKDKLIRIQIENIKELVELKSKKSTLAIFRKFIDKKPKKNEDLREGLNSPSSLSYHTKYLNQIGLIRRVDGVRNATWVLTEKGEQVMKRL